nr:MAG TPA: hypothetical protein [Caudoviricetes sp.]
MFRKIWNAAIQYAPKIKGRVRTSMQIVYVYGAGLIILFLMVIAAWVHDFYRTGVANTTLLINFFKEFTAPAVVGAFTFVSVFCVDKNHDGRPDAAEKETRKEVRRDDDRGISAGTQK